jgi:hypothetical protein
MTPARLLAAAVFALGVLTLLAIRLLATRADRRRVARSVALAAGIADERKAGWWFEDSTEDEVLAVDPPVVPPYVPPLATVASMEPLLPQPPVAAPVAPVATREVWTTVGGYRVHIACADQHERREPVTDGCAEFLVHSGGTS